MICTECDIPPVPDRLEDAVAEPQGQDVLDRLLAEVVVDAIDLALVEDGRDVAVQGAGALEVVAERLLDDDPAPGVLLMPGVDQARLAQLLDDRGEELGRDRQVIDPVALGAVRLVDALERLFQASGTRPGRRRSRWRRRSGWRTAARPRGSRPRRSLPGSFRTRRGGRRRSSRGGRSRRWRIRTGGCRPARAETGPGPACGGPGRRSRRRARRRTGRRRASAARPRARGWSREADSIRTSASLSTSKAGATGRNDSLETEVFVRH